MKRTHVRTSLLEAVEAARRGLLAALLGITVLQVGCRAILSNPSSPLSVTPVGIVWNSANLAESEISYDATGLQSELSTSLTASVNLLVNGTPESTAVVSLTGAGGSVTLAYQGPATVLGIVYASYLGLLDHYQSAANYFSYWNGPVTYAPGQTYTLTTVTSAGTASASAAAPGPIQNTVSTSPLGFNVSWSGGNGNQIVVVDNSSAVTTYSSSGLPSPVFIPGSDFSSASGLGGLPGVLGSGDTESISVQQTASNVSGAAIGSTFTIYDSIDGNPAF